MRNRGNRGDICVKIAQVFSYQVDSITNRGTRISYRRVCTCLISRLIVLVAFTMFSHCILQSQFQGLFSRLKIGVLFIIDIRLYSKVFRPQLLTERRCSRGSRLSSYGNIFRNFNFFDPSRDSISKLVRFSKSLSINPCRLCMLFNFSSRNRGK